MSQSTESDDSSMFSGSRLELPPLRTKARGLALLFGHLTPPEDVDDEGIITNAPNEIATDVPTASSFERLQQEVKGLDEVVNERDIRVSEAEGDIGNIKAEMEEVQEFMENGNIVTDEHLREILPTLATKTDLKADLKELRLTTKADLKNGLEELRLTTKADLKTGLEELRLATKADLKTGLEELRLATKADLEELKTDLEGLRLEIRASQNYRASRFFDEVQSLPIIRDRDGVKRIEYISTPLRQVKHYWNLHNQEHASELVRCLEFYLAIDTWPFKALDEADDFDNVDVDLLGPLLHTVPTSWEEAVKLSPRRSVYLLFGALGLRYDHFSEQYDMMKALGTQRQSATKSKASESQPAIRVKRAKNESSESTTEPFTT
ncbi:hypothetical protein GMDG_08483 [Pseudogymnoascus destructans 20631-21]|uniref:Uncharacterized protein n=2 Tax=Pseudogymnoascus destructans TaxID=655981 RepID=L8G4J1_PSED2|nr:hypothetical protein GMDG_08483 [Pseudogymnoascus destructans 20631-21]